MRHKDQKYIDGLVHENAAIITEIYEKYGLECRRYINKNGGNSEDATDVFQECLIKILKRAKSGNFELTVPFGGYIYYIYRNKWIDVLRKRKSEHLIIQDSKRYTNDYNSKEMAQETEMHSRRTQMFKDCFEQLNEMCQKLIDSKLKKISSEKLMKFYKLPSINAVNNRRYMCRKKLKELIEQHPDFNKLIYIPKQK